MKSLQNRIMVTMVTLTATALLAISFLVQKDVSNVVRHSEQIHSRHILNQVYRQISNNYQNEKFFRETLYRERKETLKNFTDMALKIVEKNYLKYNSGELGLQEAMDQTKETIRAMRYDNGAGYIWIQDISLPVPYMLMHPAVPGLEGKKGTNRLYYDATEDGSNLLAQFVLQTNNPKQSAFVGYRWPKPTPKGLSQVQPKMSHVRRFAPWSWVIGTGMYTDDIERITRNHDIKLRHKLFEELARIRIVDSGYFYIFDGQGTFVTHPVFQGQNKINLRDPLTGKYILKELQKIAHDPLGNSYEYSWVKPGQSKETVFKKVAMVRYFKPLDWYIGISPYVDELLAPAIRLRTKILVSSIGFLVLVFVVAWWMARTISTPISLLAKATKDIQKHGIGKVQLPITGTIETQILGHGLQRLMEVVQQNQERIQAMSNYLGNVIDSMPSMLIGVSPDGLITQWNTEATKVTGIDNKDAIGNPLNEVLPRLKEDMVLVSKAISTGQQQNDNKRSYWVNGETRYEDLTVFPVMSGEEKGAVIRIDDITQRIHIEQMMIQNEKMLSVGGLAAGMAHEINNPLGGILQNIFLMHHRLFDKSTAANQKVAKEANISFDGLQEYLTKRDIYKMIQRIESSGQRAAMIVDNILSFARKETSEKKRHSLASLVDNCIELSSVDYDLRSKFDFRQISIKREYAANTPELLCDSGSIQQVVLNILRNGKEAMHHAGIEDPRFIIRIFPVSTTTHNNKPKMVQLEIQDNGPGINEKVQQRIFEPFFTTKTSIHGTGLGLSVSYFIITENHHGEMTVKSVVGKGTTFIIRLPINS
ncbi:MAG: cache domain-containing protein [Deltaproteobacteria bacterium]|nr:cache domain-containing protein [Deltaproteobacteria bacterium]